MSSPEARKAWATIIEQPSFAQKQQIIVRDLASKFASRSKAVAEQQLQQVSGSTSSNYIIGKAEDESFEQLLSMLQLQQTSSSTSSSQQEASDFHQQYLSILGAISSKVCHIYHDVKKWLFDVSHFHLFCCS